MYGYNQCLRRKENINLEKRNNGKFGNSGDGHKFFINFNSRKISNKRFKESKK